MTVAGEQPHALVLALDDQAITVMLDFVEPVGAVGDFGSGSRNARFIGGPWRADSCPAATMRIHPIGLTRLSSNRGAGLASKSALGGFQGLSTLAIAAPGQHTRPWAALCVDALRRSFVTGSCTFVLSRIL
jgi:hypothetical protein